MITKRSYYFLYLFGVLLLISILGFIWSYIDHNIILYGDATSHLNIARRVIDSKTPGFAQLGSSWLPLFHILLIPFVANDFLYRSGIAGYCLNSLLFIGTGYFFSKILLYVFPEKKVLIFLLTILFSLNANLLYFQTTAMGEVLLVATSTAGIFFLVKYITDITSTANLAIAALFVFLSSLNRYEGWFLACAETAFVFIYILVKHRDYKKAEGKTILFGALAFLGILAWLVYNLTIFHDPFNFIHDTYTAAGQQKVLYAHGLLQTKHNLIRSIQTFTFAINDVSGILFTGLSVTAIFWYIVKSRKIAYLPIILFFTSICFFEIFTLYLGITAMYVNEIFPYHPFNVRYALFVYPGFFILISLFILSQRKKLYIYCLISLIIIQIAILFYPKQQISIIEGKQLFATDQGMIEAGNYLNTHYSGGNILASSGAVDPLFLFSGLPMKDFIYEGNQPLWENSLEDPTKYVQWVVFKSSEDNLDFVGKKFKNSQKFAQKYRLMTRKRNINIYERI